MDFNVDEAKDYVKERFSLTYPEAIGYFDELWDEYKVMQSFKINENVYDKKENYNDKLHLILRLTTQYYLTKVFMAMKIDLDDPNVFEDLQNGNISTPGRISKMWVGANTHDDRELMGGRFHTPVRLAKFPNESKKNLPITSEVDLVAVCSHHLAPFSTLFKEDSKVIISYIPDKFVLGISKLQRVVRYVAQRGWLQEDLTKALYEELSKAAETESVYVKLINIKHSCTFLRGSMSQGDGFTTEYYGGAFEDPEIRKQILN